MRKTLTPQKLPNLSIQQRRGEVGDWFAALIDDIRAISILLPNEFDCGSFVAWWILDDALDHVICADDDFSTSIDASRSALPNYDSQRK